MSYVSFTVNNPLIQTREGEIQRIAQLDYSKNASYALLYKLERGESGTPHFQGLFYSNQKRHILKINAWLKKFYVSNASTTLCNTLEHARNTYSYIQKTEKKGETLWHPPIHWGIDFPKQITDLGVKKSEPLIKQFLVEAKRQDYKTTDGLVEKYPQLYQTKLWNSFVHLPPRNFKSIVIVRFGITGTGKSGSVPPHSATCCWIGDRAPNFIDPYRDHEEVCFDDFDPNNWQKHISTLLKLMDQYSYYVPVMYGTTNWRPRTIHITSHFKPDSWYPSRTPEIMRRIDQLWEHKFNEPPARIK